MPKVEIVEQSEEPRKARVILCNHARAFAPLAFLRGYGRKFTMWATVNVCEQSRVPNHIMYSFFPNASDIARLVLRPLSYAVSPIFPKIMGMVGVIPTYQNRKAIQTFEQTVQALLAGYDVIIFPENEAESQYAHINCLNGGFLRLAEVYYKQCGEPLEYVPTYASKALKRVVMGKTMSFDHSKPLRKQFVPFKEAVMKEIESVANSLPAHKIYGFESKAHDPERIKKYESRDKYSLRE